MRNSWTPVFVTAILLAIGASAFAANAQAQLGMQQISGKYTDSSVGLEITLPDGWTGIQIPSQSGSSMAMAAPGGPSTTGDMSNPAMFVSVTDKKPINATSFQPPSGGQSNTPSNCNVASSQKTTVNGMSAFAVSAECTGANPYKVKGYMFQTDSKNVLVMYGSSSSANFDKYVGAFDSAVGTLKIANTVDVMVVPEFPIAATAAIAGVVGIIAILGRTKAYSLFRS